MIRCKTPEKERDVMLQMLYVTTCFGAVLLGAALLILWIAIEVIGYGGMLSASRSVADGSFCRRVRRGFASRAMCDGASPFARLACGHGRLSF